MHEFEKNIKCHETNAIKMRIFIDIVFVLSSTSMNEFPIINSDVNLSPSMVKRIDLSWA